MQTITIDQLPKSKELNESDLLPISQEEATAKVDLEELKTYIQGDLPDKIDSVLDEAIEYADQMLSGRNEWLAPVKTQSDLLLITGLSNKINYLIKVVTDPVQSGVYQAVAGWTAEPEWALFDTGVDFVEEGELESAVDEHNEDINAHLITLTDATASSVIKDGQDNPTNWMQSIRNNIKSIFAALTNKAEVQALTAHIENTYNPHEVTKTQIGLSNVTNDAQVKRSEMGAADGVATLDQQGLILASQIPEGGGILAVARDDTLTGSGTSSDPLGVNKVNIFQIGFIYQSTDPASPAVYYGGTWTRFAQGRVLVGVNENDTDFNDAEKTGGAKTHTLTAAQMPSHTHTALGYTHILGSNDYSHIIAGGAWNFETVSQNMTNTGGGQAHNNLQPYITCYMWVKTAD